MKWLRKMGRRIGLIKPQTVKDFAGLITFVDENAAYVSQVTLYTYIKARAGTQYPKLFENEKFLTSLTIARWHIFGACVADLALFAAAQFHAGNYLNDEQAGDMAKLIARRILSKVDQSDIEPKAFDAMITDAASRAGMFDYTKATIGSYAFETSAKALLRWAPVVDEFKQQDEEIVRNSLHLRWIGVRHALRERLVHDAVHGDWVGIVNDDRFSQKA